MTRLLLLLLVTLATSASAFFPDTTSRAQSSRPFGLPFSTPPGVATWLVGQQYGNTVGAFNFGDYWYRAGQGLHFGMDFPVPCGMPVVALADGVIEHVDNFSFGSRPHNLIIAHADLGYTVLYGHLLETPTVMKGQPVVRGEVVGKTGDPDETCVSRPHLHLEIRSMDHRTAYNPAALIDTDWAMIGSIGSYGSVPFTKNLYAPNRWQRADDQPDVAFGGRILNDYAETWPLRTRFLAPVPTSPAMIAPPAASTLTFARISNPGCCSQAWWLPNSQGVGFWDGIEGQRAQVYNVSLDGTVQGIDPQGYVNYSPNGAYEVRWSNGRVTVVRLADGATWEIASAGTLPRFSPGSIRLLWQRVPADNIPGEQSPMTEIWVSNPDGSGKTLITTQQGGSVLWLDDDRLLFSRRSGQTITLSAYTLSTGEERSIISAGFIRGLSISPGGRHVLFYRAFQADPNDNGMYLLDTVAGTGPLKLPWFGTYRWRDSMSLVYIPFAPGQPFYFRLYDIITGEDRVLTDPAVQPFTIANDDWSIAPDGSALLFWSADDYALWTVRLAE